MHIRFWALLLLPLMVSTASGTDIYKCTGKNGVVSYGDTPCPGQQTNLLHKETEAEAAQAKQERIAIALDAMIDSGHVDEARSFAVANGVTRLFQERLQANVRRQQEKQRQEMANDAEIRRENEAEERARQQQGLQEYQAKLVKADADEEKFRKEHWSEIKQQHLPEVLQSQSSKTFNVARGQWCSVGQDGSTVCQATP